MHMYVYIYVCSSCVQNFQLYSLKITETKPIFGIGVFVCDRKPLIWLKIKYTIIHV